MSTTTKKKAQKQIDTLHLFDTDLQALCRRGYQGGMPIELLSDVYLYEEHGKYFHTVDGRFAKIWRIGGVDASLMNNDDLFGICGALGDVLNKYPANSSGQFIRHTHRDIRPFMELYRQNLNPDMDEFETAIAESIMDRQYSAGVASNGFFAKLSPAHMKIMREDALSELSGLDDDVRSKVSETISREINEGRYPFVSQFYLVLMWEPSYLFGKFLDGAFKAALASVGLADADELAYRSYKKHALQFGEICDSISQTLAAYNFSPEVLNAQGLINLMYQIMNPVRSFRMEPPKYRPDVAIFEALKNPAAVTADQAINSNAMFADVEASDAGLTIHDSGYKYHVRTASLLGKPGTSAPGMLQEAMTGIESESLICLNWSVPTSIVVGARLKARKQLIKAKVNMRLGDKEITAQQLADLESVQMRVSSENVTNREQMFDVALHVNLMGFDADRLEDLTRQLESRLWRLGRAETLRGDAAIRSSLPINYNPKSTSLLRRDFPHLTESLSHLCPIFQEYQGVADPGIIMNNRSGQPVFLDLWGKGVITAHSLIVGTTGSGKSFTFNNILMGVRVKYRPKVWIIDKGDSYESLCLVLGGNYVRLAMEPFIEAVTGRTIYPICINPFWLSKDETGKNKMPEQAELMFVVDMMLMMMTSGNGEKNAVVHPKAKPLVFTAVRNFFAKWIEQNPHEEPIMSDFIPELQATEFSDLTGRDLAERLVLFYGEGPYAAIFDGKLQVDWSNDFTVLEIQRMAKSDALAVVTMALFQQIDTYCKYILRKDRKKLIAVDEAWATLSSPTAASALAGFYREMRKYNAGCLLISQTVGDFVKILKAEASGSGDTQDGILENTSHYFLLACSESDYKLARNDLAFTEEEVDLWRSLASLPPIYSEVFYRMRTAQGLYYSGVFRLFASSVSLWIASTQPDDFAMRERKAQEILDAQNCGESVARQRAIVQLAKEYPYGARFRVDQAA